MELKRREFLVSLLAAGAAALCSGWSASGPGSAGRRQCALSPRIYPGPVVPLDEQKMRRRANWLG